MKKVKILIDILMTIVFILLMCNQVTEAFIHEILGIAITVLFIIHQILNRNFYKNIFKGKYNKVRITYTIVDILLLIMMIIMFISSFMVSEYLFIDLDIGSNSTGRLLHVLSTYSIFMLAGIHLGLHYNQIIKLKKENKIILNVFFTLFGLIFGISGFIKREFIQKITLQDLYPLYSNDNPILFFIDYIGIFVLFMMIGYGIFKLLTLKKNMKEDAISNKKKEGI